MLPDTDRALKELAIAEKLNPGAWVQHSRNVGIAARNIAKRVDGLLPEKAYVLGLLHAIGRRVGVVGAVRHVWEGYYFGELAATLETDLYLLPVNTHVILATPADCTMLHSLKEIAVSMHGKEGAKEDTLSDNVYLYCRRSCEISIA